MNRYEQYVAKMRRIADIQHAVAVLHWDKEVNLPSGASFFRSQQIATLSSMAHSLFTEESTGQLLEQLSAEQGLTAGQKANVERTLEDYRKEVLLPSDFVERLAMAQSEAFGAWIGAREANDFSVFAPALAQLVVLKKEEAALRGQGGDPYDALLDIYEPGLTTETLNTVFSETRAEIIPLIRAIREKGEVDRSFLHAEYPKAKQWQYGLDVIGQLGYRFEHGRQDISAHPFTISFSPQDVRLTTRIDEHDFSNMLWSCIHECGHGMYEQGLPVEQYGLPLGSPASLAIHESQSRLWENQVGRSAAFWQYQLPLLRNVFPNQLEGISAEHFHRAINHIAPNLIRTEADELHYHLHVLIRFEIERGLVHGEIDSNDLPGIWKDRYKKYLDVDVPDDRRGVLQDVHWSHGSFGYFPTYSLGSFYAAQMYHQAEHDVDDLEGHIAAGEYTPLHDWLKEHVYAHGRRYEPGELVRKITGETLNIRHFIDYARRKYGVS